MHLLLTALGSYGDVHPMVGVGQAMRGRGHRVQVVTNPHFEPVVRSAGLEMLPIGTAEEYDELTRQPGIWHPIRGPMLVMKIGIVDILRRLYAIVESNYVAGETVLGAHPLDMASRIFHEKHGAPLASFHFAPLMLRSRYDSPRMMTMLLGSGTPSWLKRMQYWLADRLIVDRWIGPAVNGLRTELGLPPVRRLIDRWHYSPQRVIGLFPEWYAPRQPDWPEQLVQTGFPLWDQAAEDGLPDEVLEFLEGGDPPIVFSPGSAMTEGQDFFATAVESCRRLGRRGILLTKYPDQLPPRLPPEVRYFGFVPFSQLLPRSAAFVHHGGIGSSAQGLAAGVPQLVMPMAYDQLDNATRLGRLGVATYLRRKNFRPRTVTPRLQQLLDSPQVHEKCHRWAQKCDSQVALGKTCELLEELGGGKLS